MQHFVSFETAKKLEVAGFGRPSHEIGQFWYNPNGRLYHITSTRENDIFVKWGEGAFWSKEIVVYEEDSDNWFYAATATDILEQLKTVYLAYMDIGRCWGCFTIGTATMVGFNAENAAEAVAEAYLSASVLP
jgi:hypothetical protein